MQTEESKELSPEGARIAFWIFAGLLGMTILWAISTIHTSSRYQSQAKRTRGRIVRNMPQSKNTGYNVWVEYKDEIQIPKTFRASVEFYGSAARVGAPVTVLYFPGQPSSAVTQKWLDSKLRKYVPFAFIAGLLFFTVLIGKGISQRDGVPFLLFQK